MDLNSLTLAQVAVVLIVIVGCLFLLIKHLISFSYSQQMLVKNAEAKLIEKTIEKVVSDFHAQVETLKNDIKFISISFKAHQESTFKTIDKIESRAEIIKSKQDQLEGKLDYLERHSTEIDKKIEEKVRLVFLDVSKV